MEIAELETLFNDARANLGEKEYKRRLVELKASWAADEEAARLAEEQKAAANLRAMVDSRKQAALKLADAMDTLTPHLAALEKTNQTLIERGLSRATKSSLQQDAFIRAKNIEITKFRAGIQSVDAALLAELKV